MTDAERQIPDPRDFETMRAWIEARERAHPTNYVLDPAGEPVPEPNLLAWGAWFERATHDGSRVVGQDTRTLADGIEVVVSTVFLGLDHNWYQAGDPVLWETMLFWPGDDRDQAMERYTSRAAAGAGHQRWVAATCAEVEEATESVEAFAARVERLLAEVQTQAEETEDDDDGAGGPEGP